MPPIISHLERQKIETSPTQTSPQSLRSCVSAPFKTSQPPLVPSLTPPPPRHYLRNATSSEKLQGLIQKRSDIYTRVQQAQKEEVDSSHPSAPSQIHAEFKARRPIALTRSSSFTLETSVDACAAQVTRSASWKARGVAPGRHRRSLSTKSHTEVHFVKFESISPQRREVMVLGLSELDAHFRNCFDSGDGTNADVQSMHHEPFNPNHGELGFKDVLAELEYVFLVHVVARFPTENNNSQIRIGMAAHDTQRPIHDSIPSLDQDVVDLDDHETADSHRTQHSFIVAPLPIYSPTPQLFTSPQRRRTRILQSSAQSKELLPPPRKSSLVSLSRSLEPYSSGTLPVGPSADIVDSHDRGENGSHKSHSKPGGCKISKAIRHLGGCLRSNACASAPRSPAAL